MAHTVEQMKEAGPGEWTPRQRTKAENIHNFDRHEDAVTVAYYAQRPVSIITPFGLVDHYTIFNENLPGGAL